MRLEWVIVSEDSGISHAFPDEGESLAKVKSLCGLKPPRQLVLPYNLPEPPKDSHCARCGRSIEKREKET